MAVETRISSLGGETRTEGHDGSAPLEEGPSYLRLVCRSTVRYASSRLGGGGAAEVVRAVPERRSESMLPVEDPSAFLDLNRTSRAIWRGLAAMPELRSVDLSPSNWDIFRPDVVATRILHIVRDNDDRGLCGGHYRFAVDVGLRVTIVFGEPKAVLRHCREEVMQTVEPATGDACGICLDDLATSGRTTPPPVNLPCGHAFHSKCITRWLFKRTTCPLCMHDLTGLVASPWTS